MKKHVPLGLLLALCCPFIALFGQGWQPLYPADRCHFRHSDSVLLTHTLLTDSVVVQADGASRYALNRVVADCDTCTEPAKLRNQGQFLQENAQSRANGSWLFEGKRSFVLFPQAPVGATWLMDTAGNIRATVVSVEAGAVLGEVDSLKTIQLSNGSLLVLSQNHGLLRFPDLDHGGFFQLAGIENRHLGEHPPTWMDFHQFAVGDVFQRRSSAPIFPGEWGTAYGLTQSRILEKFWDLDTLKYRVQRRSRSWREWSGPPGTKYQLDTVTWSFHPSTAPIWTAGYMGQLAYPIEQVPEYLASHLQYRPHALYGPTWALGTPPQQTLPNCSLYHYEPAHSNTEILPCDPCFTFWHSYAAGLGLTSFQSACFEAFQSEVLEGFVKNGDTTGTVSPDSEWSVAVVEVEDGLRAVSVQPNPAQGAWQLVWTQPLSAGTRLTVYNAAGKMVLQQLLPIGTTQAAVDGSTWPNGVYGAVLERGGWRALKYLVKH